MPLTELDNFQIDSYFRNDPLYLPCTSVDLLPRIATPTQPSFTVYNSASSNSKTAPDGIHWLAYFNVPSQLPYICFWDSFGCGPDERLVKWSKKSGLMRVYNALPAQGINKSSCGWFCVYVLKELRSGRSYADVIGDFSYDTEKNERLLERYFHKR